MARFRRLPSTFMSAAVLLLNLPFESSAFNRVITWGENGYEEVRVAGLTNALAISAGDHHYLELKADRTVAAWGTGSECVVPAGLTNVIAVSAGYNHSLALKQDGTVVGWGGALGATVPAGLSNVTAIAAGSDHSLALRSDGTVVAWGYSAWGYPATVPSGLSNVVAVAAGWGPDLALLSDGRVVGWGSFLAAGGPYTQTNIPPPDLTNAVAIAAGRSQALALRADGTIVAWGISNPQESVPPGLSDVASIAAKGGMHPGSTDLAVALRSNRTAVSWSRATATGFSAQGMSNLLAVAAGTTHFLAIGDSWPMIVVEPRSASVFWGGTITLQCEVLSDLPVTYQWKFYQTNSLPGATNASLVLTNIQPNQEGPYGVTARNAYGMVENWFQAWVDVVIPWIELGSTKYSVLENEAVARVAVSRPAGSIGISSVDFSTSDQTAVAGVDYVATNGTLVFGDGQTNAIIEIPILDNSVIDGNRNFNLTLSNPQHAVLADITVATIAIVDEDSTFAFSRSSYAALEGAGSYGVTIVRRGNLTQPASVDYVTVPGTATPGLDYSPVSGTLAFAPGETNGLIEVPIFVDAIIEGRENLGLELRNPSNGARLGSPATAVLSIVDVAESPIVDLEEDILHALVAEGGPITFAVDGTIALTRSLNITKDTILDGSGHDVTLSGVDAVRVLYVNTNVSLTLSNVTIASGLSDRGGGLYNAGGFVTMVGCKLINNHAQGTNSTSNTQPGGFAAGGAVFNEGDLWITNSEFSGNIARGGNGADLGDGGAGGNCEGGAIYSLGDVWIAESHFLTNQIFGGNGGTGINVGAHGGPAGSSRGGALSGPGVATINSSRFDYNVAAGGVGGSAPNWGLHASGGGGGGTGEAGAIYNPVALVLSNCVFRFNRAFGGGSGSGYLSGRGGTARGGSVFNAGVLSVNPNCLFAFNAATAGTAAGFKAGQDGSAFGGGIFNAGALLIDSAVLASNKVYNGEAAGGGIYNAGGSLGMTSSVMVCNSSVSGTAGDPRYYGGPGFDSFGGAVFNAATGSFSNCSFISNSVLGGWAALGSLMGPSTRPSGSGYGAGIASSGFSEIIASSFVDNSASGGPGVPGAGANTAAGGSGIGGGLAVTAGSVRLLNTTVSGCSAVGAPGGSADATRFPWVDGAPGGSGYGGGIFVTNASAAITNCTVAGNTVAPGQGGPGGPQGHTGAPGTASWGGIVLQTNGVLGLQNTIVTANTAGDVSGAFSGSHNLIGVDARLGAPTINALGTICLPLMPDSPAIDAALPVPGINVDQRGFARTYGNAPDIGAYEWNSYAPFVLVSLTWDSSGWHLKGSGPANQNFRVLVSNDLTNWIPVTSMSSGPKGLFEFLETLVPAESRRFYRIASP